MSPLIHTANKQIEFTKKFNAQLMLHNFLIGSNFAVWLVAIFLLSSCGSPIHPSRKSLDKGEYTAQQCLKISKVKSSFAKRPLSHQSVLSFGLNTRRHN